MPVDSLFDMARRGCIRFSRRVVDVGDLPYDLVRPILLKIENPAQLHQIEQNCPQIIGEDAELWLNMIKRDIPDWDKRPHQPSNPKSWYKVYLKLKQDARDEQVAGEERLKARLSSITTKKEAQVVNRSNLPPPPPSPSRFKTVSRARAYGSALRSAPGSGPMHKMSALEKIKKDARSSHSPRMNRPTHELTKRSSGIRSAPMGFVEDLRRQKAHAARSAAIKAQVPPSPTTINTPTQRLSTHDSHNGGYDLMKDREARLRALKSGNHSSGASNNHQPKSPDQDRYKQVLNTQFLEDDDLGDDIDDDDEDGDSNLFGNLPKAKQAATSTAAPPRTSPTTAQPAPRVMVKRRAPPSLFYSPPKRRNVEVK